MRLFSLIMLAAMSFNALAQVDQTINFRGQNAEVIKVEKNINVVRPVPYQVPDTCYNQIPYQSYECHDVTRYRQECHYVPASENCWTDTERVCRNVSYTDQECSTGSSHEVCHDTPGREVCTERPTRTVCRTDTRGQQHCTEVGGGRSCQTVGGGRSCHTVPGERTCRNVTRTRQDCDNVPRRRCETVPGRNVCQDIPYSEQVCGNETRYRAEPYACERTEYRDVSTPKKLTGAVNVHFQTNGLVEEFPVQIAVAAPNAKFETFATSVKLLKEPKVLVILKKKEVKAEETDKEIVLSGDVVFEIIEPKMVAPAFPANLKDASFNDANSVLTLTIEGGVSAQGSVDLLFTAKPKLGKEKTIAELKAAYPSDRAGVAGDKLNMNLAGLLQNELVKKNKIALKLSAPLSIKGDVLNATKPEMSKSYSLELRK